MPEEIELTEKDEKALEAAWRKLRNKKSADDKGEDGQATLVVRRVSPTDVKMRYVIVSVDGSRQGQLAYGQSLEIRLDPGRHTLLLDNTWAKKSLEIDLAAGSTRTLLVGNRPGGCFLAGLAFAGAGPTQVFVEEVK